MHFRGRDVQRRHELDRFRVATLPVRQTFDGNFRPSLRVVVGPQKFGELLVGRGHVVVDRLCHFVGQPFLVVVGKGRREFLGRQKEWVRGDDAVALAGEFLEHELGRHESVLHALAQHLGHLIGLLRAVGVELVTELAVADHRPRQRTGSFTPVIHCCVRSTPCARPTATSSGRSRS